MGCFWLLVAACWWDDTTWGIMAVSCLSQRVAPHHGNDAIIPSEHAIRSSFCRHSCHIFDILFIKKRRDNICWDAKHVDSFIILLFDYYIYYILFDINIISIIFFMSSSLLVLSIKIVFNVKTDTRNTYMYLNVWMNCCVNIIDIYRIYSVHTHTLTYAKWS